MWKIQDLAGKIGKFKILRQDWKIKYLAGRIWKIQYLAGKIWIACVQPPLTDFFEVRGGCTQARFGKFNILSARFGKFKI